MVVQANTEMQLCSCSTCGGISNVCVQVQQLPSSSTKQYEKNLTSGHESSLWSAATMMCLLNRSHSPTKTKAVTTTLRSEVSQVVSYICVRYPNVTSYFKMGNVQFQTSPLEFFFKLFDCVFDEFWVRLRKETPGPVHCRTAATNQ